MAIRIYPVEQQTKGGFNDGEIVENKPIQMSPDKSKLQPYSNIFYWAHASATVTSTIGLHPHQGFEIMFQFFFVFDTIFDKMYLSHHIHLRKPAPEIFDYVINDNQLDKAETFFIDDSMQHIEGARIAGIESILMPPGKLLYDLFRETN